MKRTVEQLKRLRKAVPNFMSTAGDAPCSADRLRRLLRELLKATREDVVVGLDEDLEEIKNRLRNYHSSQLQVISIVGMGGTGKTTLAKLVYDDTSILNSFDIRAWVTASQDYIVGRILLDLGISVEREGQKEIPTKSLIRKHLEDKRFLIIIDDLSSKKTWDDIKMLFPNTNSGSRIMLTTRLHDVAAYVDSSSPIHTMRLLDANSSWELLKRSCLVLKKRFVNKSSRMLKKKVFVDKSCPIELEDVGKKIVKDCRGLPLSIVVVAGILSSIPETLESWNEIAANDGNFETIISMSYNLLPDYMRACFLYMGGFPKDYEIRTSELVKLWISEGFLKCEDEAENCLENLVKRNLLVSFSRRKFNGRIKGCNLHDMVRDFCIRQAEREKFLLSVVDYLPTPILRRHFLPRLLRNYGRISATWHDLHLKDSMHTSLTHSIICIPQRGYRCVACVNKFSSLRVFHVLCRYNSCERGPTQVFDLIQLTYFASYIPTTIVPSAISKLQNLETLIIYNSEVVFPVEIWTLRKLRHLRALSFNLPPCPDEATLPLENLQMMSLATNFVCSGRMMEMIPKIKKLGICYSMGKFCPAYQLCNLKHLNQLEKLKLESKMSRGFVEYENPVFPVSLKKLSLCGLGLPWKDMGIVGSLPNLRVLKLRNNACSGEYWKTTNGEFEELKVLLIDGSNLKCWTSEGSNFRRLECLILLHCPYLREIPSRTQVIPNLKLIELDTRKGPLFGLVKKRKLEQLQDGNDWLQVRVKHY